MVKLVSKFSKLNICGCSSSEASWCTDLIITAHQWGLARAGVLSRHPGESSDRPIVQICCS